MKRAAAGIAWVLLASLTPSSYGRSCFVTPPSVTVGDASTYARGGRRSYNDRRGYTGTPSLGIDVCKNARRRSKIVCHMNKRTSNADGEGDDEQSQPKRGVFKRMREKIASSFGGNKKGDDDQSEGNGGGKNDYKPNPLDGIRLKVATAMANVNLFQFGKKEEWVVACTKARVGPGQIVPCVVNGLDIIIFASRDGQRLDAFANACPHLGSPFDLATIERKPVQEKGRTDDGSGDGCVDCIVCPVHRTAFEIQSGQVRGEWCPYPPVLGGIMGYMKPKTDLVKFAVRLRGKNVEVRIATSVKDVGKGDEKAEGMRGIK
ncbi:hypothetical protein ACHAXT_010165 [Thalassiosira profunda]